MSEAYVVGHTIVFKTPEKYAKAKIRVLKRDFCINPTDEEIEHIKSLKTQIAIDNAFLTIINNHWK
jgi:hypothetical protein